MISKKKAIIYGIVLVIVTALFTSSLQIAIGDRVVISKEMYESYKKYNKMVGLEGAIKEDFYKKPEDDKLVNSAIKGLFSGLEDRYSQYYTKEEFNRLKEQTSGSFVGIGVFISPITRW